ncbi:unnamed protein product [Trichogramma brassicae]|uniref:Uncharacterized protein n=1 Tax=Trichogramma brassicae TaxID=86971 RepID=A0A6H5IDX2_9HYME|nr:unnamed protein product [Trichogramma brassicae]
MKKKTICKWNNKHKETLTLYTFMLTFEFFRAWKDIVLHASGIAKMQKQEQVHDTSRIAIVSSFRKLLFDHRCYYYVGHLILFVAREQRGRDRTKLANSIKRRVIIGYVYRGCTSRAHESLTIGSQSNGSQTPQHDTKMPITSLLTTCFGNKSNLHEPHLRSSKQQQQLQQQQQQQLKKEGCQGNECCGIKHMARQETGTWLECDDEAVRVDSYERYIRDCEAKEAAGLATTSTGNSNDTRSLEEQRKERNECLDMLKRELKRIQEGGDPYDFDYLLDEEEKRLLEDSDKEEDDNKSNENKIKIDEDQDQPDAEEDLAKSDDDESEPKKDNVFSKSDQSFYEIIMRVSYRRIA